MKEESFIRLGYKNSLRDLQMTVSSSVIQIGNCINVFVMLSVFDV